MVRRHFPPQIFHPPKFEIRDSIFRPKFSTPQIRDSRAISSAQSPLGRNIAIIRRRYAIRVADVSEHHVYRQVKQLCRIDVTDTARGILILIFCVHEITSCIYMGSRRMMSR